MPFSHHSHSGQFCNHAASSLASILATASAANFHTYALTEHCPRSNEHLYPEELASGYDFTRLNELYDAFIMEATRLRDAYARGETSTAVKVASEREGYSQELLPTATRDPSLPPLKVLIGFEAEWITPTISPSIVKSLMDRHGSTIDFFVGSIHFVREIPIDFDRQTFEKARDACGGTDDALAAAYFDDQYEMLETLQPKVVGHFDLIRLFSDVPDRDWSNIPSLWTKIRRNLEFVAGYGGLLELNTSALRKGLGQPYPRQEICEAFMALGGHFVLSDDCHAIAHVGTNFRLALDFVKDFGLKELAYLERGVGKYVEVVKVSTSELEAMKYWEGV